MYMRKFAKFLHFARKSEGFEEFRLVKGENFRDDKSIIAIIVFGVR